MAHSLHVYSGNCVIPLICSPSLVVVAAAAVVVVVLVVVPGSLLLLWSGILLRRPASLFVLHLSSAV